MSVIGETEGPPVKVGVAVNDVMSGLNAAVGILSAPRKRTFLGRYEAKPPTPRGQVTTSWLRRAVRTSEFDVVDVVSRLGSLAGGASPFFFRQP
jgi:hypothetical protein